MNPEHPTPWKFVQEEDSGHIYVCDKGGKFICDVHSIQVADRIIRAVNGEEAMKSFDPETISAKYIDQMIKDKWVYPDLVDSDYNAARYTFELAVKEAFKIATSNP